MSFRRRQLSPTAQHGNRAVKSGKGSGIVGYRMVDRRRQDLRGSRRPDCKLGRHYKAMILTCQSYHMSQTLHPMNSTHASWHASMRFREQRGTGRLLSSCRHCTVLHSFLYARISCCICAYICIYISVYLCMCVSVYLRVRLGMFAHGACASLAPN